ncbi:cytochrome P450 [Thozetella sp. PMI_491]|nr:cytochrome P450 [Thozetella sp. PMI_491]
MTSTNLALGIFLAELSLAYWVLSIFVQYWRLRHIPGPFIAGFTPLWRAYHHFRGFTLKDRLIQLHEQYGPLVRISPNVVSVADGASVKTIYTAKGEFPKSEAYGAANILINGKPIGSIIAIQDENAFKGIKRAIGAAFITKNLLDYEPDVDSMLEVLQRRLLRDPKCVLFQTLKMFQLDFLFKATFSNVPGCLEDGIPPEVQQFLDANAERGGHWFRWCSLPRLERLLFQSPIWGRYLRPDRGWQSLGLRAIALRKASEERKVDLLQRFLDASEKHPDIVHPQTVSSLVFSTISAGADTTTAVATAMITHLVRNPDKLAKLRAELEEVRAAGRLSDPPKYAETSALPYLDAVMKEAMRVSPILPLVFERVVPPEGTVLAGKHIPGGTVVGCMPAPVMLDKACWGEDVDVFRPERWLTDRETRLSMERGFLGFGAGSRSCLGRHIAELELKKVVPQLLLKFDVTVDELPKALALGGPFRFVPMTFTPKT